MRVKQFIPAVVQLEDPETLEPKKINIRVKRMTPTELTKFRHEYARLNNPPSDSLVARLPEGDEQDRDEKTKAFAVDDAEVKRRRLADMSAEERLAYDCMSEAEDLAGDEFITRAVHENVAVVSGQIFEEQADGSEASVTTGADLMRLFGASRPVRVQLLATIMAENALDTGTKKAWRSRFDSTRTSDEREKAAAGGRPDPTAGPAASAASAPSAGAPDQDLTPSS